MGETRDPDNRSNDAPETPSTSSILGQAPFKLDLRIVPRTNSPAAITGEVPRLKPVDRDLLPDRPAPVAQVIELPTASDPAGSPALSASSVATVVETPPTPQVLTAPPAPPAPPSPAPPPAQTVAPGISAAMPNVMAPFASRSIPTAGQLTLAPIAPRVTEPRPIDFNAVLGSSAFKPTGRLSKRRNPFGLLVKLVVLAGLLGGGYLAVDKFVLTPKWQDDVKSLADGVAERRGLDFDEAVKVKALPRDEYALALASTLLRASSADPVTIASEWRAMGLAEGAVDPQVIGRVALADQPAFYDPTDGTIYELAEMSPELRGIALSRALTMALLDQHYDWSAVTGEPSARLGSRALFDGDATSIRGETTLAALVDLAQVANVSREIELLRSEAIVDAALASPFAIALIGSGSDATMHLFPATISELDRNRAEQTPVPSDAAVFDASRPRDAQPAEIGVAGAKTVGMMYWYYALAGRIGNDAAWAAAVHWGGDATLVERASLGSTCVTSTIAALDQVGQLTMIAAFEGWAAGAPVESRASVAPAEPNSLVVKSCDPGLAASTISNTDIRPFGNAPAELAVVEAMVAAGLDDTQDARACVVRAVRGGQVFPAERPFGVDRSLTLPSVDVTSLEARLLRETCGAL